MALPHTRFTPTAIVPKSRPCNGPRGGRSASRKGHRVRPQGPPPGWRPPAPHGHPARWRPCPLPLPVLSGKPSSEPVRQSPARSQEFWKHPREWESHGAAGTGSARAGPRVGVTREPGLSGLSRLAGGREKRRGGLGRQRGSSSSSYARPSPTTQPPHSCERAHAKRNTCVFTAASSSLSTNWKQPGFHRRVNGWTQSNTSQPRERTNH